MSDRTYIKDLRPGDHVSAVFRLLDCQGKGDNPRAPELTLKLGDKSGDIRAIKWKSSTSADSYSDCRYVLATGQVNDKGYGIQIELTGAIQAHEDFVNEAELVPCANLSFKDLTYRYTEMVNRIHDQNICDLVKTVFTDELDKIATYPAARSMHHAVLRGLYQHTIEVTETALAMASLPATWGYRALDLDIVIAGALLHDIGKIRSMQVTPGGEYENSLEGALLEHITIGIQMIVEAASNIPVSGAALTRILHIIASHHGKQEYGSPVTPATPEALCVHLADMYSMTINVMDDLRDKAKAGDVSARRADIRVIVG